MPMLSKSPHELTSSHLGLILEDALVRARQVMNMKGSVVFLGMDAPEVSWILKDIHVGLLMSDQAGAMLCPADDGGYAMLCVPPHADASRTFARVHWSHPLTAVSQLKALTDQNDHSTTTTNTNMTVHIGRLLYDIDEPQDVKRLCERLRLLPKETTTTTTTSTTTTNSGDTEASDDDDELVLYQTSNRGRSTSTNGSCVSSDHPECYFTRQALLDLGQL